jgi:RNA polymerase sigma-70 factor, ECF subfamily
MGPGEWSLDADTALMLKASAGDHPSFELLLERHRTPVINHLYRLVHNRATAEDLAQDVFLRVYRARDRYRPDAKFTTWLFRITTNIALNWRRDTRHEKAQVTLDDQARNIRRVEPRDQALQPDERLVAEQRARQIQAAVESLPGKQLAAVVLHKYEGMEYREIADVLGCSIPALKSLLFRAYQTLRRRLAPLVETQSVDVDDSNSRLASR